MIAQAVNLMNFLKGPKQFIEEEDGGKSCIVHFPQETRRDPSDCAEIKACHFVLISSNIFINKAVMNR